MHFEEDLTHDVEYETETGEVVTFPQGSPPGYHHIMSNADGEIVTIGFTMAGYVDEDYDMVFCN